VRTARQGTFLVRKGSCSPELRCWGLIARRLHLVPRFRQQLHASTRTRRAVVDAQRFDLGAHIGVFPVPPPAGEAQLLLAVERLRARRLARSRPLWEMCFLPGLPQHRVGFFIRMHHTVVDGMAGVALMGTQQANPLTEQVPPWTPAPLPSTRELLQDAVRNRLHTAEQLLRRLGHPLDTTRRVRRAWPSARIGITDSRAPQTSLNRRIGVHRTITIIRCRLDLAKQIAHAYEAKVSDVLLAAVAGGLRQLLGGRGAPVDGVVLRAFVPVSLHHEQGGQVRGNQDAGWLDLSSVRALSPCGPHRVDRARSNLPGQRDWTASGFAALGA
jgi:diacylglycerol O-acyltransferase / wax synthase